MKNEQILEKKESYSFLSKREKQEARLSYYKLNRMGILPNLEGYDI
jgi:hypothetical protein